MAAAAEVVQTAEMIIANMKEKCKLFMKKDEHTQDIPWETLLSIFKDAKDFGIDEEIIKKCIAYIYRYYCSNIITVINSLPYIKVINIFEKFGRYYRHKNNCGISFRKSVQSDIYYIELMLYERIDGIEGGPSNICYDVDLNMIAEAYLSKCEQKLYNFGFSDINFNRCFMDGPALI